MTVRELVKVLEKFDKNAKIVIGSVGFSSSVEGVKRVLLASNGYVVLDRSGVILNADIVDFYSKLDGEW